MKKIFFWFSTLISTYLLISTIAVAIEVAKHFTNYGLGVLVGKLILCTLFTLLSVWMGKKSFKKQTTH